MRNFSKIFLVLSIGLVWLNGVWAQNMAFDIFKKNIDDQSVANITSEISPTLNKFNGNITDASWDVLFQFNTAAATSPGVETDGTYIYASNWQTAGSFSKYTNAGVFVENFTVAGAGACRDLAFDGTYFYGGAAAGTIYKMDFTNKVLVGTIPTGAVAVRHIGYDPTANANAGGFWAGNWTTLALVSMTGTTITNVTGLTLAGMYGNAYDPWTTGGPYLWLFDQGGGAGTPQLVHQFKIATLAVTGVNHNVSDIPGYSAADAIAGGLATSDDLVSGKFVMLVNIQQTNNLVGVYELALTANTSAPGPVTNLMITPGANGALNAALAWTNPSVNVGGGALTQLTAVKIYRNEVLIQTVNNPPIGGNSTYTDNGVPAAGMYTYKLVPENSFGAGTPVVMDKWIGPDVPAAVTNLMLTAQGEDGLLTWTNPTAGLHGGYYTGLTGYNIVRMPDNATFNVAGPVTQWVDNTVPAAGTYYYTVTTKNAAGTGGTATSNPALLNSGDILLFEEFTGGTIPAGWSVVGPAGLTNWSVVNTGNAGGTAPELRFGWSPSFVGLSAIMTGVINTDGLSELQLEFKHFVDWYSTTFTCGVATTIDGGATWEPVWTINPTGNVGPETVTVTINNAHVGNPNFQLGIFYDGDSFEIDYWYIDNIILSGSGGGPVLTPPTNLAGVVNGNDVTLTWDYEGGASDWLHWDDGTNYTGLGLGAPGQFEVAARFTDLAAYDGWALKKVAFFPRADKASNFTLNVYSGTSASTLLLIQPLTGLTQYEWNEISLTTPVQVDASTELWVSIAIDNADGDFPMGIDAGPAVAGYGDMITLDGVTWESMATSYGLNYNHNIQAYVEEPVEGLQYALPKAKNPSYYNNTNLSINPDKSTALVNFKPSKGFIGYMVQRNGADISELITSTIYTDTNLINGVYTYTVKAVYDEGVSEPSNPFVATINVECNFNPDIFSNDSIFICGSDLILDAGEGFDSYLWNTGESTQNIIVTNTGWYSCSVSSLGCFAIDSIFISITSAFIEQNDTTICAGESVSLSLNVSYLPLDGLKGYWPFDGNAMDMSTDNNHGTPYNALLTSDRYGMQGKAYQFNGSNSYIELLHPFPVTNTFTISFWAYNQMNGSNTGTVLCDGSINIGGNDFLLNLTSNRIGIRADKSGCSLNYEYSSPAALSNLNLSNRWIFVAWVMTPSKSSVYLDGVKLADIDVTGTNEGYHDPNAYFGLRRVWTNPDYFFNGKLDDFSIWNRAFSDSEIMELFHNNPSENYSFLWSTGDTTTSISVTPTETTTYYCNIFSGINICTDSVTVFVSGIPNPDLFPLDTIYVCGESHELDAGPGYLSYLWNTDATTQTIIVSNTGWFTCTVSNMVCSATDSIFISIINTHIQPNDTIVNVNQSVTLTVVRSNFIPDEGLIAFYPYNGNALDASGNGHHGTTVNAIPDYDRFGIANKAYRYDGYTGTERFISSNLGMYDTLSFSMWFKAGYPSTHYPSIFQYGTENRLQFGMLGNHPAYIQNGLIGKIGGGAVVGGAWVSDINSFSRYDNNNWHHLVANFIPDDSIYLFIDNFLVGSDNYQPNYPSDDLFYIGRTIYDTPGGSPHGGHFNGSIDDVRVYNRPLTKSEISNLFFESSALDTNYTYLWSTGATTSSITVTPTQTTTYYCAISNGIHNCIDSVTVTVLLPPEPTCPEDIEVCLNASLFELTGASPAGGTYSGEGVLFSAYFDPATAGLGEHVIIYTITDLGYTSSCSFTITVMPLPEITCPEMMTVCINAGIVVLDQAMPVGGYYEGLGVFLDLFNPLDAGVGDHLVTYYYTAPDGCNGSCTFTLTVTDVPEATCPAGFTICISQPAFGLSGAEPTGGTYTINGVPETIFDPASLGPGSHLVEYTYQMTGCSGTCSFCIEVVPMPSVDLGADRSLQCNDFEDDFPLPFTLSANVPQYNSLQWSSSGTGWISNPNVLSPLYHFSQQDVETGQVTFTLEVEPAGNCSGTITDQLTLFIPSQLIDIPESWSGISSYIVPTYPNIAQVTGPCNDNLTVQISIGGLYWPEQGVNTLINWNPSTAYKVKYDQPCCLPMFGNPVALPSIIHLNVGVNYLPVHSPSPIAISDLFGPDTSRIISLVDIYSLQIFSPGFGNLNTLQFLEPGVGYLAYMMQSVNVVFTASTTTKSTMDETTPREPYDISRYNPWNEIQNTGTMHFIAFDKTALTALDANNIIGVFDERGTCTGFVEYQGEEGLILPVFGDDPYTPEKEGMAGDEHMIFRIYDIETEETIGIKAIYDVSLSDHDGLFKPYGLSKVALIMRQTSGVGEASTDKISIYPNPAGDEVAVTCSEGIRKITIINTFGQLVGEVQSKGEEKLLLSVEKLSDGVYILAIETTDGKKVNRRLTVK